MTQLLFPSDPRALMHYQAGALLTMGYYSLASDAKAQCAEVGAWVELKPGSDLWRSEDGRWLILKDCTQAPEDSMTDLTKLREDAERIAGKQHSYVGDIAPWARAVLSLLDAQSAAEEALRWAKHGLHAAETAIAIQGHESSRLAVAQALSAVNAVLAGKNTEKPGASSNAATGQADLGRAADYGRTGSATLPTGALSASALDEERALLELTLYGGRLDPGGAPAAASNWITRRDALLARLSANPKGPKE